MALRASQERVSTAPEVSSYPADKKEIGQVERVMSGEDEKVDHIDYDRVDKEVAKYADANAERVHISEEENKRLKRMIDRRVLPIMIVTYFLQALDKGTMSFSSIVCNVPVQTACETHTDFVHLPPDGHPQRHPDPKTKLLRRCNVCLHSN